MTNWNTTGKVKAAVIAFACIINLVVPVKMGAANLPWPMIGLMFFVSGAVFVTAISFINKIILGRKLAEPQWNENPLVFGKPLVLFHFGGIMLLATGAAVVAGVAMRYGRFEPFGFMCLLFGAGVLTGVRATLKFV